MFLLVQEEFEQCIFPKFPTTTNSLAIDSLDGRLIGSYLTQQNP
jgi:hypothetical protein